MKLQLTCVILVFLPLVLAGPVAKFLYTGLEDIIIVESKDAIFVSYKIDSEKNHLIFSARNKFRSPLDKLEIDLNFGADLNFTVEFFVNKKGVSNDLKGLVVSTKGQISLRESTKEERDKINDFKGWWNRKEEDFKVTFDRGEIKAETCWLSEFKVIYGQENGICLFNVDVTPATQGRRRMILQDKTLPSKSFAIELQWGRDELDCKNDKADGLTPSTCIGDIGLKNLKEYYKSRNSI